MALLLSAFGPDTDIDPYLPHKNNEQQVRAPANVYLFNQTYYSYT